MLMIALKAAVIQFRFAFLKRQWMADKNMWAYFMRFQELPYNKKNITLSTPLSLGRPQYNLVVDEDVKKPTNINISLLVFTQNVQAFLHENLQKLENKYHYSCRQQSTCQGLQKANPSPLCLNLQCWLPDTLWKGRSKTKKNDSFLYV